MKKIKISNRLIGEGQPVFIIAEIGMSHNGSMRQAKVFIDAAAKTGVDAVKFQTHIAEAETLKNAPPPKYFTDESRYDYFKRTAFNQKEHLELKKYSESKGLIFISSPFSIPAIDLLENIDVSLYKVPSGEVTNIPFLKYLSKTGKPILLSTGMSNWTEIETAVKLILKYNKQLIILQCTSEYPCSYQNVGLNVMEEMKNRFNLPVGLSDHTKDIFVPIAAVTLGACVIEKHFTISKKLYGPDPKNSLEPGEFKQMVEGIRAMEKVLLHPVNKDDIYRFKEMKKVFQKSIVSVVDINRGERIKARMVTTKKPGNGLSPILLPKVIGATAKRNISKDSLIKKGDIEWRKK